MVSEMFEYPFDLAKVRLQAQLLTPSSSSVARFNGPMDCLMQTWKEEGVRGLYRVRPLHLLFDGWVIVYFWAINLLGFASANRWFYGGDGVAVSCLFGVPECDSDIHFVFNNDTSYDTATGFSCRRSGILDEFRLVRFFLSPAVFLICLIYRRQDTDRAGQMQNAGPNDEFPPCKTSTSRPWANTTARCSHPSSLFISFFVLTTHTPTSIINAAHHTHIYPRRFICIPFTDN
jgi:hypothetical protein